MGECKSPYNRGRGEVCIYERDANGPTDLKCCPVKCYPPVCYDKVDVEFSCGTTTTTTTTTPCPAFSGMHLYFSACHGCPRALYEFYVGSLDSSGQWDPLSEIQIRSICVNGSCDPANQETGPLQLDLSSYSPGSNVKSSNPYPCNGEKKNKNGFECCVIECPRQFTLSVDEAIISDIIVNSISTSPGDNKDCIKIAVKLKCVYGDGTNCHSDVTQFYAIGSDGCCLGGGTLDALDDSQGHGVGVTLIELCCNGCEKCVDKSWPQDYSVPAQTIYGEQTISLPEGVELPTKVTITGVADDDLVVDGEIINENQSAGAVNYTFTLYNSTFTIAGYNYYTGGANYNYKICFNSKETTTTTTQSPWYYWATFDVRLNIIGYDVYGQPFYMGIDWLKKCECDQSKIGGDRTVVSNGYPTQSECCYQNSGSCSRFAQGLPDKDGNINNDWVDECTGAGAGFLPSNIAEQSNIAEKLKLNIAEKSRDCINSNTFISNCTKGENSQINQHYTGSKQDEFVLCYKNKGHNEFIIKNEKDEIIKNIIIEEDKEDIELISKPENSDYIIIETITNENSYWEYCLLCPETISNLLKETKNSTIKNLSTQNYGCKFVVLLDTTGCCIEVEGDKIYAVGEGTLYASVDSGSPGSGEGLECCSNPTVKICEVDSGYCGGGGGGCSEGEFGTSKYVLDGCEYTITISGQNSGYYGGEQDCKCKNPNDNTKEEGYPTGTEAHPDPCPPPFRIMKNKNNNELKILVNKNFVR